MNRRDISALDALQCKLVNALYPLAIYHDPSTKPEQPEQPGEKFWNNEYALFGGVPIVLVVVGGCFLPSIHLSSVWAHRAQLLAPQLTSVETSTLEG